MKRGVRGAFELCAALLAATVLQTAAAGAHPASREELAYLNAEIAKEPGKAELYLKRGRLHARDEHRSWALADFERAADLGAAAVAVDLMRGELFLDAGWGEAADVYLSRAAEDAELRHRALKLRGRTRLELERFAAAAEDFEAALATAPGASPDFYIEVVRAIARAGRTDAALAYLDDALERFGPLTSLGRESVELEILAGRTGDALVRLDALARQGGFRELWLTRRAEVLELDGRPEEARAAFAAAHAALAERPPGRRETRTFRDLAARIDQGLERLGSAGGGP